MTNNDILREIIGKSNKTHFAKKHDVDRNYLGFWLNNSRNIKTSKLEKIAKKEGYKIILKLEKL